MVEAEPCVQRRKHDVERESSADKVKTREPEFDREAGKEEVAHAHLSYLVLTWQTHPTGHAGFL